jgi:hypothetical protein
MAQRLSLLAPSGGRVDVELASYPLVSHVASAVRFVGGSFGTGFQIGPRGYHDFACTRVSPATVAYRLMVHGREVVVAEADDRQSSVATLIGPYHELMTVFAGPAPRSDRVFSLFSSLDVADEVAGMAVGPAAGTLVEAMTEHVVVAVRGRGVVSIPGRAQARDLLPRHAGAAARHGEVWRVSHPGGPDGGGDAGGSFLLGCPAGLAEIHLSGRSGAGDADLLGWLNDINIRWHGTA